MQQSTIEHGRQVVTGLALLALLLFGGHAAATTAADTEVVLGDADVSIEAIEPLSPEQLDTLVAPIALYPDDLLGIVLPASTYPLQVVQAARFLEARAADDSLRPDSEWDDSIVALLNYPEVLALINDDLDWTWQLGEAVLMQQAEVIDAVSEFRERARLAGNLESDEYQTVEVNDDGDIEIDPADPEELYIPYYEPEEVTVYQRRRVYNYYPRPYPVYYYPYPSDYYFPGNFWGVTSVFSIGWQTQRLHLLHYGFSDHPYFGYSYYDPFYYRQPHLWLSLNYYEDHYRYRQQGRHHRGNYWYGNRHHRGAGPTDRRHEQDRAREGRDRADRRHQRRLATRQEAFGKTTERTIGHSRSGRTHSRRDAPALTSNRGTITSSRTGEVTRTRSNRRPLVAASPRRVAERTATQPASQSLRGRTQPRVADQPRRRAPTPPRNERRRQLAKVKAAPRTPRAQTPRAQPARAQQERVQPSRTQKERPANVTQQRPRQVAAQSAPRPAQRESRSRPPRQSSSHSRSQGRSVNRGAHRSASSAGLRRHD